MSAIAASYTPDQVRDDTPFSFYTYYSYRTNRRYYDMYYCYHDAMTDLSELKSV